jgi:putative pyruvate formate lyase activating enzyme
MVAPAYLDLGIRELGVRASQGVAMLANCRACPRDCGVNRLEERWAACKTGRHAVVSSFFPHFGEEDCLRGWNGSGTIFFGHCNLRCVFCQNFDISQDIRPTAGPGSDAREIAAMMLWLQDQGCHNINFVTPEHVVPQIVEAVAEAAALGLRLPIVYNTSGYDALDSIHLLDGIVDIRAMHAQVGPLQMDDDGLATRGVLIRHLVMPGCLDETRRILEWIVSELGPDTYVNLMDQYYPAGKVGADAYPEINRRLTAAEFREARQIATDLGLRRLDVRRPHPRLRRLALLGGG